MLHHCMNLLCIDLTLFNQKYHYHIYYCIIVLLHLNVYQVFVECIDLVCIVIHSVMRQSFHQNFIFHSDM